MPNIGGIAREIVAKRVAILAAIPTAYALAVGFGWTPPWSSDQVVSLVGGALTVLAAVVGIAWARSGVTPVHEARDAIGRQLVPTDDFSGPEYAAMREHAGK